MFMCNFFENLLTKVQLLLAKDTAGDLETTMPCAIGGFYTLLCAMITVARDLDLSWHIRVQKTNCGRRIG